jgi:peptidyl-prolyl cis-trans isomerase-like 1
MKKTSIVLALAVSLGLISACTPTNPTMPDTSSSSSSISSSEAAASEDSSSPSSMSSSSAWSWDGKTLATGKHTVVLKTSKGDITLELDAGIAPKTVTNFLALALKGSYEGLTFHRVIPGFMIQGGDPNGNGTGGKSIFGEKFEDEIDPSSATYTTGYKAGVIAMANAGPNTNGSQFFIMDTDYPLPPSYTIFGHVTSGQDVVHAIATTPRDGRDMPNEKVTFKVEVKN